MSCDVLPIDFAFDERDASTVDAVFSCNDFLQATVLADCYYFGLSELVPPVDLASGRRLEAGLVGVSHVLGLRNPFEIGDGIIRRIAVLVIYLKAGRVGFGQKGHCD